MYCLLCQISSSDVFNAHWFDVQVLFFAAILGKLTFGILGKKQKKN